jgi:hypothetical protein
MVEVIFLAFCEKTEVIKKIFANQKNQLKKLASIFVNKTKIIVVNFNKKTSGYRLVSADGALLNAEVPINHIKVISYFDYSKRDGNYVEIKKILKH